MSSELRVDKIVPVNGVPTGGGGGVIQTIMGSTTTQVETTSKTFSDSTLTATITPTRSDSKILITVAQLLRTHCTNSSVDSAGAGIRLLRGNTVIVNARDHGATDGSGTYGSRDFSVNAELGAANLSLVSTKSIIFLDSPNSTSAVTYKTQGRIMNTNMNLKMNPTDTVNNQPSIMILQEVSG
tara:strand:- start:344 stop:892 length:549 start_codon:yes stop_codon:yes gene_type:complete